MKARLKNIFTKISFWSFFIGLVFGFGGGVILLNALVPDSAELIRLYRLDQKSITEDKAARESAKGLPGTLQVIVK